MKPWKPILLVLLAVCLSVSGCIATPSGNEKVMLDVECGWQEIKDFGSGPREGRLIINDSIDGFIESHEYTNIKSPVGGGMVEDTAIFLGRYFPDGQYPAITFEEKFKSFVANVADYDWLIGTLENLTFSTAKNTRSDTDARVVVEVFRKDNDDWNEPDIYWVCADGIVLKEGIEEGYTCFYASHTPIDYYNVSALQVKYEQITHSYYLSCFSPQITRPEQYRLCISSNKGHRDFSLAEARDLFSDKEGKELAALTGVVNPDLAANLESYLKITEYSSLHDGKIESTTYYLSPEGKLTIFRDLDTFIHCYWNGEQEQFNVLLLWESEPVLDYSEILKLLDD